MRASADMHAGNGRTVSHSMVTAGVAPAPPLAGDVTTHACVVRAGMAGLTACLLAREGGRFGTEGRVVNGPAVCPLGKAD